MSSQESSAISTLSSLQQMRPDVQPFSIPVLLNTETSPSPADLEANGKRGRKRKSGGLEEQEPTGSQRKSQARRHQSEDSQSPAQDILRLQQGGSFADDEDGQQLDGNDEGKIDEDDEALSAQKRKEMHKEVERKRRDNINSGILELAKIVPDCEKSKSSVVHKSVEYIRYLQKTNLLTIERWKDERKEAEEKMRAMIEEINELRRENHELRSRLGLEPRRTEGPQ